jgi:hypothetical protein
MGGKTLGNKARGTDLGQQRDLGYIRTIATALDSQQNYQTLKKRPRKSNR